MHVLGIQFDSKLTWAEHVNRTINKSKKALHAIRIIKKYINKQELLNFLISNYNSILYYNSEIWHLTTLKHELKQKLLSASVKALKLCSIYNELNTSHEKSTREQRQQKCLCINWLSNNTKFTTRSKHHHTGLILTISKISMEGRQNSCQ